MRTRTCGAWRRARRIGSESWRFWFGLALRKRKEWGWRHAVVGRGRDCRFRELYWFFFGRLGSGVGLWIHGWIMCTFFMQWMNVYWNTKWAIMNERILKHKMSDNKAYLKLVFPSYFLLSLFQSPSFSQCTSSDSNDPVRVPQNDPCLSFFILDPYIFYFS